MRLIVSYQDQNGVLSAMMELPESVALTPKKTVEYGDALVEVIIGAIGGEIQDSGEDKEPPRGFYATN